MNTDTEKSVLPEGTKQWLSWLSDIPLGSTFIPYPIQLANAIRIMKNDAVYLFDEVGSGKTYCAGIMARTYLQQYPEKKVLVITTNTVRGLRQFENDWKNIMPDEMLENNVVVWNNLATSSLRYLTPEWKKANPRLAEAIPDKWGLVIIDEAQEFLNTDTQRNNLLRKFLQAEKVVFLTATPLRGSTKDSLSVYAQLANCILSKQENELPDWIGDINTIGKEQVISTQLDPESPVTPIISARFDPKYPVTRYFKDTVRYLNLHEKKERARRVVPEFWDCKAGETRLTTLTQHIREKLDEPDPSGGRLPHRFVIFVRLKSEAAEISKALQEVCGENKVRAVFSENKGELEHYQSPDGKNLPTVLIVSFPIGEAGVNLPCYDHVVHWHISEEPSRLEQRYGRVDRMTSLHPKIYSCFVMPAQYDDTNYSNFVAAANFTMGDLLTALPARNVLLNKETLRRYDNYYTDTSKQKNRLSFVRLLLTNATEEKRIALYKCCRQVQEQSDKIPTFDEECGWNEYAWRQIWDVLLEAEVINDLCHEDATPEELCNQLLEKLDRKIHALSKKKEEDFSGCVGRLEQHSDKIFYLTKEKDPESLMVIGAQDNEWQEDGTTIPGCAAAIENTSEFQALRELIRRRFVERRVCALLIIDMIHDYASPDGREGCPSAGVIVPNIRRLKEAVRAAGGVCVYVNTAYWDEDEPEVRLWGPSAMGGTPGAEVIEALRPEPGDITVQKHAYDGFYDTGLDAVLRAKGVTDVIVTGVHTHVCVMQTALGAFERGYRVIALEDAMTTDRQQEIHKAVLPYFRSHLAAELTRTNELMRRLSGA